MPMAQGLLVVETTGQGLYEVTSEAAHWVAGQGMNQGLLTLFIRHSSASLLIQENAAPAVRDDLAAFFRALVPEDRRYRHADEGPDDMPSHIRSALLPTQLAIPVAEGRMLLGTWQGIYVFEHRRAPHRRELVLHLAGD